MSTELESPGDDALVATGVAGLDEILGGGLTPHRVYLLEGNPGSGKTTLALRCLLEGVRLGESVLYITLSETKVELAAVAKSHGWSLEGVPIVELVAQEAELEADNQFAMFETSEMELGVTTRAILAEVGRLKPVRVVVDSLSEMRLLAQNALRYRRQILALKQFFIGRRCTVLLLDDKTGEAQDLQLQSIAHGVICVEQLSPEYGAERRRLRILKLRGQRYRGGYHDFKIIRGGLEVYPRLVAAEHPDDDAEIVQLKSGVAEVDALLGGGLEFGTCALLIGPAGSGKSSLTVQFAKAAADAGIRAAVFAFDERRQTLLRRSKTLGMDLSGPLKAGTLTVQQVDPAELSPGEFAHEVRRAVEGEDGGPGARVVVIDSLNGYMNAMPEERFLTAQLHELLTYLGNKGVATFLVVAQHGLVGHQMMTPVDTSYVADVVILFRFFEAKGRVRKALSVIKKRIGRHESTIREYQMSRRGIEVGEPLVQFQGILTGTPAFIGPAEPLLGDSDE
ncbi:ATPase domain-containing protein [Paludisphaera mucosa]|uniref:non-specific serine/threonine protein kinase n=1 Tax=Paludisphaera mucosa TaxID=3030827 RepID=A0ABT6F3Y5_9BACT|nr:ATPase domain-containing protein [Paludisphaera mucosa]MDG3002266.1 ATPase domain-containing protein [Paludisphaera mucosa]